MGLFIPAYELFYTMTDGEDLTKWQRKTVGLTTSAELTNLEQDIPFAIRVAARLVAARTKVFLDLI